MSKPPLFFALLGVKPKVPHGVSCSPELHAQPLKLLPPICLHNVQNLHVHMYVTHIVPPVLLGLEPGSHTYSSAAELRSPAPAKHI